MFTKEEEIVLLNDFKYGDQRTRDKAFEALYENNKAWIKTIARKLRNRIPYWVETKDIELECVGLFYKNLHHWDPYRQNGASLTNYIYIITVNGMIKRYNAAKRQDGPILYIGEYIEYLQPGYMPEHEKDELENERKEFLDFLETQSELNKDILLQSFKGVSLEAISKSLHMSKSAVSQRKYNTIKRFQELTGIKDS